MNKKIQFIIDYLNKILEKNTPEYVGNNFNEFFSSESIDNYLLSFKEDKTARQIRASLDILRGKIFEEVLKILLNKCFEKDKSYFHIKVSHYKDLPKEAKTEVKKIRLFRKNFEDFYKKPDIDLVVYSEKLKDRFLFLSVKGTSRERIGQFLSNIFIFDPVVLYSKYKNLYKIGEDGIPKYKMAFVCFDMAKQKDFSYIEEKKPKHSQKQIEVLLVDDDPNIGYGVFVLNNFKKLHKVGNFSELVGKIKSFFT